jgi:tellurite resistance protein
MGTIAQIYESGEQSANKGMFNNLVMLARIDGNVDESELKLLGRIASRLSLTPEQIDEIVAHPDQYPMIPPVSKEERFERFIQFIEMICIDGVVDPSEEFLANKYGLALGFDDEDVVEIEQKILSMIQAGKDSDEILNELM